MNSTASYIEALLHLRSLLRSLLRFHAADDAVFWRALKRRYRGILGQALRISGCVRAAGEADRAATSFYRLVELLCVVFGLRASEHRFVNRAALVLRARRAAGLVEEILR